MFLFLPIDAKKTIKPRTIGALIYLSIFKGIVENHRNQFQKLTHKILVLGIKSESIICFSSQRVFEQVKQIWNVFRKYSKLMERFNYGYFSFQLLFNREAQTKNKLLFIKKNSFFNKDSQKKRGNRLLKDSGLLLSFVQASVEDICFKSFIGKGPFVKNVLRECLKSKNKI